MKRFPPFRRWLLLLAAILLTALSVACDYSPCTPADSGPFEGCCINDRTGDWCCNYSDGWQCW
jgi:hypothetical protein